MQLPIRNVHRTVGAMLSGEIARRYGSQGLPDDTIHFQFNGSAGQSFGAFLAERRDARRSKATPTIMSAKDFRADALSSIRRENSGFVPEENILDRQRRALRRDQRRGVLQRHGRRALRGAQFRRDGGGRRRRRSRLRIHDEWPGGGAGHCGRNFAAGMSGGIAYVLDEKGDFTDERCNQAAVDLEPVIEPADIELLQRSDLRGIAS